MTAHPSRTIVAIALTLTMIAASCRGGEGDDTTVTDVTPETSAANEPVDASTADERTSETVRAGDEPDDPGDSDEPDDNSEANYLTASSDELFDPTRLHTFEIDLPEEALAEIDADPTAEQYVEGSVTFGGETVAPIGVRYKGSVGAFVFCTDGPNPLQPSGAKTCRKLSMKLKMNWVDSNDEFYGVRKVQLHSQNLDPTKMHERLGYWLFREMGVPVPRSTHAKVVVNGEYVGVFALTEQIDGRFTRENFDDGTGNLYKEVWPFDEFGEPQREAGLLSALETNEDEQPTTEIISTFATEFLAAEPDDRGEVLNQWTDLETLVRAVVVDRAIRNDDGPLHWYCFDGCRPHNYYWCEDPTEQRLTLIPWDLDNAFDNLASDGTTGMVTRIADEFGEISNDCESFPFGPLGLPQRSAACDPLVGALSTLNDDYDRIRAELVAGPMSAERIDERLAIWGAQIEPAVAEAAALFDDAPSTAEWRAAVDELRADIANSRASSGR